MGVSSAGRFSNQLLALGFGVLLVAARTGDGVILSFPSLWRCPEVAVVGRRRVVSWVELAGCRLLVLDLLEDGGSGSPRSFPGGKASPEALPPLPSLLPLEYFISAFFLLLWSLVAFFFGAWCFVLRGGFCAGSVLLSESVLLRRLLKEKSPFFAPSLVVASCSPEFSCSSGSSLAARWSLDCSASLHSRVFVTWFTWVFPLSLDLGCSSGL
ncbi:hypothetical protein F2Q69_00044100 [Brassica cretica]|uniref:Uncharacterized protein n=1 Tax=Brassica cretica TaxID=69181 RepID=A0A8S9NID5_BRACR|nr:hypothetical protein F2Q69_00044100 [Brassica cretica]